MIRLTCTFLILAFAVPASAAPTMPTVHATNGLLTTASVFRIERDGPRPSGPRAEVVGVRATSAVEIFPQTKGAPDSRASLIQRILPTFVLQPADLDIPDRYDAVFFAEAKVIRVRLNLKIADNPLGKEWINRLHAYFNYLDRDRDGYLNRYEADMMFSPRAMQQLLQTGFANPNLSDPARTFAELDIDRDGRVSPDELIAYYAPVVKHLIRSQFNNNAGDAFSARLTDEMFKLFDLDKDGKLSKSELGQLEQLIPQLDQNEDECLSNTELVANLFTNPRPIPTAPVPAVSPNPLAPLQVWVRGTIPESIVEQLFQRYDKDKNLRISKAENPFSDALFAQLDKNGDGVLSLTEMLQWKLVEPDLRIEWTLAAKQSDSKIVLLPASDGKPAPLANMLRITETGKAHIRVGSQNLELGSNSSLAGSPRIAPSNQFGSFFQQADPSNRGYFTEKDLVGPQFQFLRILFDVMDKNMDGRVTRAEFDAYFVVQNSFVDLPLTLLHGSITPSLFQLLDTDSDGRLSVPELRAAWMHLKDLEPSGGEYITRAAIQPHGQLRFGRNNSIFNGNQPVFNAGMPMAQGKGPLWFRKMDRNTDGVISRSEFPGRSDDFDKLDTNHDNLIDLTEAEAADKRLRTSTPKK